MFSITCYRVCLCLLIMSSLAFLFYSRETTFRCYGIELDLLTLEEKQELIQRIFVDRKHKALYCSVPKIGSTYLKRLFLLLSGKLKSNSVFNISTRTAHSTKPEQLQVEDFDHSFFYNKLKDYKKILVVRHPYKRLFSGYVDKFLGPNRLYHATLGRQIIRMFRPNASTYSLECGHDVTFPEFIKYFLHSVTTGHLANSHFIPIHRLCRPCFLHYDIIKMENLTNEVPRLLTSLGVDPALFQYLFQKDDLMSARLKDEIRHAIFLYYKNKNDLQKCLPAINILKRLWKRDSIRGFIDKSHLFPFKAKGVKSLNRSQLFNIFKSVYRIPQANKSSQTYNDAIHKAFLQIPNQDMMLVHRYLETDCKLFGYDSKEFFRNT